MQTKIVSLVTVGLFVFGVFSASPSYSLKSYSLGPSGTNSAKSQTYNVQGTAGEQGNLKMSGTTYSALNGSVQTEQLNVPPAPTLSNAANTYYDKLLVTVNTGGNPSDTTYAIAVSTDNFAITSYLQPSGVTGASPVYQTYSAWGGSGGTLMTGLVQSTTYQVKVAAKEGMFTNTAYGPSATLATVATTVSFSLTPNSTTLSNLLPSTIVTSSNISFSFATNADSGGDVYISGLNGGLKSSRYGYSIPALSGDLSAQSQGFGVQGVSASQTSGGPLSIAGPFNGTGNTVGSESTTFVPIFAATQPLSGGTATANVKAKASSSAPASNDYQETLTFIAAASF